MKTPTPLLLTAGLCLAGASSLTGQPAFDSGSDGSMGDFNPTVTTNLVLPPDGIFHFRSVNIPVGVGVGFIRNALNTPVYILAQSNIVILEGGFFVVDGAGRSGAGAGSSPGIGGPGGFDGGFGTVQGFPASDGQGPGGGKVAAGRGGVFATASIGDGANSNIYGNSLLSPLIGGSGGAGASQDPSGGGGGGGAITLASSTVINLAGRSHAFGIVANGGYGYGNSGGGSGGAIRLVAPVVTGTAIIQAVQGDAAVAANRGSQGRIRIDTLDRFAWRGLVFDAGKRSVGSQMRVFPPGNPRLDIVEAAGQAIPEGTNAAVNVSLLPGASTNQVIKVKATGFTGDVPVTVAVVPEAGPSTRFDDVITVTGTNPVIRNINVVIPIDSFCNVKVWTR